MKPDTETYVKLVADLVGLPIPSEYLAGTVANFERSAALANLVLEFALTSETESAALFSNERFAK